MESENNENEILYITKRKILIILSSFLFLYCLITYINYIIPNMKISLINLNYLICSCCLLIIIRSTYTIYKNDYLRVVRIFYITIALNTINSILAFRENNFINVITHQELISNSMLVFLLALLYLYTKRFFQNKEDSIMKFTLIIILAYIVEYFLTKSGNSEIAIIMFNSISIIIISLMGLKQVHEIINKQIYYLCFGGDIIIIISILNLLYMLLNEQNYIISIIINGLYFVSFGTNCIIALDKIVNNPYKCIFKQIYDKNSDLNELNKKISIQNRDLEFSQMVIKKKDNMVKSFFRNIPIALVFINKKTRRITFANRNFMEISEETNLKNIVNKKLNSFFNIEDNQFNNDEEVLIRGSILINGRIKNVAIEVIDDSDNHEEVIISFTDITEKVKLSKMKETVKNKVFEEKIKRDFLSNISHDLKTPVNVIYSATQLIDIYLKENNYEGIDKYNKISRQNCLSLTKFTNNLIDRSKIYSDNLSADLKVSNVVDVIENIVLSLVDYAKNKSIDLIFDTDQEELYAKIDCEFMQRIIINLISNSIKYCNFEGQVYVKVTELKNEIKIIIEDNGIGMDEEFLRKAFTRYSMGENNEMSVEKGTGIGLFVVKKLMEGQGGKINITSKVNEGTKTELIFNKVVRC